MSTRILAEKDRRDLHTVGRPVIPSALGWWLGHSLWLGWLVVVCWRNWWVLTMWVSIACTVNEERASSSRKYEENTQKVAEH